MSDEALSPLVGPAFRVEDRAELEEFLTLPGAEELVAASSFEQVFFTVKTLGLADSLPLLPLVTERQTAGFIDLDCWRKDNFVRQPFMQWIAAFVQVGPEATVRALSGIDEYVTALFLKDLGTVYELERDEPPPDGDLTFSPDGTMAFRLEEQGEPSTIASLILDALFRYTPDMGYSLLRKVRYTTRTDLEETAYQNKVRRLDVHGFVDYFEALSIYGGHPKADTVIRPNLRAAADDDDAPDSDAPQFLPTVFAEAISEGGFLLAALTGHPREVSERLAQELTALGNRILSANLVNLGEVEAIRLALSEMRDFLTIGLQALSRSSRESATEVLTSNHVQTVFKVGFDLLAALRGCAEELARFPSFSAALLESPDREFYSGLIRFKPILWEGDRYRNFQSVDEAEAARVRLDEIRIMAEGFLRMFPVVDGPLRKTFNTAVIRLATSGEFSAEPLEASILKQFLSSGIDFPELNLPEDLRAIAARWLETLEAELTPLVGTTIDARYVDCVLMRL